MAKIRGRRIVDRARYREYQEVAEHFRDAAQASMELDYWTAAGVLIVHSAIAYADALSIKLSGQKSVGEGHEDSITLVDTLVANGAEKATAINQLKRIIEEKTKVSYLGELYTPPQTRELWKRLERFRQWARSILER